VLLLREKLGATELKKAEVRAATGKADERTLVERCTIVHQKKRKTKKELTSQKKKKSGDRRVTKEKKFYEQKGDRVGKI